MARSQLASFWDFPVIAAGARFKVFVKVAIHISYNVLHIFHILSIYLVDCALVGFAHTARGNAIKKFRHPCLFLRAKTSLCFAKVYTMPVV